MKNFDLSLFLGCCAIAFGIVIAGKIISAELPDTTQVPSSLSVVTHTAGEQEQDFGNYLSQYDISRYLHIAYEDVEDLLESGALEGTYTMVDDNSYIFSRQKLDEWVEERIETDPTE